MQNLMPPVDTPDNLFHDGDPTQGVEGTNVTAKFLNDDQSAIRDTQAELINVLAAAAMQPDPAKQDQLVKAIQSIVGSGTADKAKSADKLSTARNIAGHPFDGTADISISASDVGALPSDGKASSASTADKLSTARKIANHPFDGSTDISISASDVGAVSSTGGSYNGTLKFGQLETLPTESNASKIYSARGGSGAIVSGVEFHWYDQQFNIGITRDASTGTGGLVFQHNGFTRLTIDKDGNLVSAGHISTGNNVSAGYISSTGDIRSERNISCAGLMQSGANIYSGSGLYESGGTVRVYSSNNPPPNQSGSTTTGNSSAYYRHGNGQVFMQCIGGIASNSQSSPNVTVYLPAAFPNGILAIAGSFSGSGGSDRDSYWTASALTSSSFALHTNNMSGYFSFVVTGY